MDNLTHSLTGLLLSRAGFGRGTAHAAWMMVIAANVPDIDILTLLGGSELYFDHHRGLSHALLFAPVMALIPVVFMRLVSRNPLNWLVCWTSSLVGVLSHLLLDWTNAYGIRLWLPFSSAWPALDATSVIDVVIWSILLLAALAPVLGRLISSEIGAKGNSGRGWAIAGLMLLLVYDASRVLMRNQVIASAAGSRVLVMPALFNPLEWQRLVEHETSWTEDHVQLGKDPDPRSTRVIFKSPASPAIDAAKKTYAFEVLRNFSKALTYTIDPSPEDSKEIRVRAVDLRFGFTSTALLDKDNRVQRSWFGY